MTDLNALVSEYYDLRRDPQALVELAHRWWSDIDPDDLLALARAWDDDEDQREARLRRPDALANAAAWYAAQGIAVFPCEVGGKRPIGRLAPHGLKDATCDADQVAAWWQAEPQANIGVPTGHGVDVVDVDGPEGWESWAKFGPSVPVVAKVFTGGDGLHAYVASTGRSNGARLKPGIDYRGAGGYVIAPPSRHSSGDLYRWHPLTPPTLLLGGAA